MSFFGCRRHPFTLLIISHHNHRVSSWSLRDLLSFNGHDAGRVICSAAVLSGELTRVHRYPLRGLLPSWTRRSLTVTQGVPLNALFLFVGVQVARLNHHWVGGSVLRIAHDTPYWLAPVSRWFQIDGRQHQLALRGLVVPRRRVLLDARSFLC